MGEIALSILRWTVSLSFMVLMIGAFTLLLNLVIGLVLRPLNQTVVGDLIALIQLWLPFNLDAIFWWFTTILTAYVMYRLAVIAYKWISNYIGSPF